MEDFFGLNKHWHSFLKAELSKSYISTLGKHIQMAYALETIFPKKDRIFQAFNHCLPNDVKLVIIGQDPYHGLNQANGLCFSVNKGEKIPPSLRNIYKELSQDIPGFAIPNHGDLSDWSNQGVLLLNAVLTVKAHEAGSHKNIGWEHFTDAVISTLSQEKEHLVFLLWGQFAIEKAALIDANKHLVLQAAHPSPLARGAFFGSKHFSQANAYLQLHNKNTIDWHLKNDDLFSAQ